MLKNKVELLQINDKNLFGKDISDHLTESVKSKKSSKEFFLSLATVRNPFNLALHFNNNTVRAEGRSKSLLVIQVIKEMKLDLE